MSICYESYITRKGWLYTKYRTFMWHVERSSRILRPYEMFNMNMINMNMINIYIERSTLICISSDDVNVECAYRTLEAPCEFWCCLWMPNFVSNINVECLIHGYPREHWLCLFINWNIQITFSDWIWGKTHGHSWTSTWCNLQINQTLTLTPTHHALLCVGRAYIWPNCVGRTANPTALGEPTPGVCSTDATFRLNHDSSQRTVWQFMLIFTFNVNTIPSHASPISRFAHRVEHLQCAKPTAEKNKTSRDTCFVLLLTSFPPRWLATPCPTIL